MGYRSTFVTDDQSLELPQWFVDKWKDSVYINEKHTLPISSRFEMKEYGFFGDVKYDLQKVLKEGARWPDHTIHLMLLHEDGAATQYVVGVNTIEQFDYPSKE